MELTDANMKRVWAMLRVEYDLNKSMNQFGYDSLITISDFTRSLPKPLREEAWKLFAKMDEEKNNKK